MKILTFAGAIVGLFVVFAGGLAAQDYKLLAKDLPAAVQKAAQAELAKGPKLVGYAKEVEDGKTMYEMATTISGHTKDFLFNATGTLLEVEEETPQSAVPPAAVKAIAAKGTFTKIESLTKAGKLVGYESIVKNKAGKEVEVAVDAAGKTIEP
jgi:uncharacterized membrane protein YkoI